MKGQVRATLGISSYPSRLSSRSTGSPGTSEHWPMVTFSPPTLLAWLLFVGYWSGGSQRGA